MIVFEDPSEGNSEECTLRKENPSDPRIFFSVGRADPSARPVTSINLHVLHSNRVSCGATSEASCARVDVHLGALSPRLYDFTYREGRARWVDLIISDFIRNFALRKYPNFRLTSSRWLLYRCSL